jgi:DNA-binding transcriptional LysR family regulator
MHKSGLIELEAIVAIARHASFRVAAAELGMSSTALSHSVRGLEARLGVRLFNRTTRSVSLSEAGEEFVATVAPALADIKGAMEAVNTHRDTPTGTLRINSSVGAARRILTPVVLEYLRRYPDMKVDLVTEGRLVDIVVDGFDAGIRTVDNVPKDMIAVPFGPSLRYAVVGSPNYFEMHAIPRKPLDLLDHVCIRSRLPSGVIYRWEFEQGGVIQNIDVTGPLTLDEPTLILEAARQGAGLAHLSEWSVETDVADGKLIRVLKEWTPILPGLCLYYPGRRHVPASLRAFVAAIRETAR